MKFRKALNASFVLVPIMLFLIGIPLFFVSFTAKDANNMKKILQEAAYTGALAGSYTIDVTNFQNGVVRGRPSVLREDYPIDKETDSPVAFMIQKNQFYREKASPVSKFDCLDGGSANSTMSSTDLAAKEVVAAVKAYLDANLNKTAVSGSKKAVYTSDDFNIAIKFDRDGVVSKTTKDPVRWDENYGGENSPGAGPYNKVTVSVVLNYKPTLLEGLIFVKDYFQEPIPIYGTSSAKTKTVR